MEQRFARSSDCVVIMRTTLAGPSSVTELAPAPHFWPAESEHQDYFNRNPWSGYCRAVVAPKVAKFRKGFAHQLKERAA